MWFATANFSEAELAETHGKNTSDGLGWSSRSRTGAALLLRVRMTACSQMRGHTCERTIKSRIFKDMARVTYLLCVCVCAHICVSVCVHVHLETRGRSLMSFLRHLLWSLLLTWSFPKRLGGLGSEPQGSTYLCLPSCEVTGTLSKCLAFLRRSKGPNSSPPACLHETPPYAPTIIY